VIVRVILWFNRIIGITFGGITIDSNGRISSSKWLTAISVIYAVIIFVYDLYQYVWNHNQHHEEGHKNSLLGNNKEKYQKTLLLLIIGNEYIWLGYKFIHSVLVNFRGYCVVKEIIIKIRKYRSYNKRNAKIITLLVFWLLQVIVQIAFWRRDVGKSWKVFIWQLKFKLSFIQSWSTSLITWLVSVIYASRLDEMVDEINDLAKWQKKSKDRRNKLG